MFSYIQKENIFVSQLDSLLFSYHDFYFYLFKEKDYFASELFNVHFVVVGVI